MKKIMLFIASFVFMFVGSFLLAGCESQFESEVSAAQVDGEQAIVVSWTSNEKEMSEIDQVDIVVKHSSSIVSSTTITDKEIIASGSCEIYAYYGNQSVFVTLHSGNDTSENAKDISLYAEEYNIAPLSGSMPVLLFSLLTEEITTNDEGEEIPTFIWLTRCDAYDWENLPSSVYAMPNAEMSKLLTHDNYDDMVSYTDAYIEELYSINPTSKFNLYINDYNAYLGLKLLDGNGISEENSTLTLLSDGTASYVAFREAFDVEDATSAYAVMAEKLETLVEEVVEKGDYYWSSDFSVNTTEFRQYAYVLAHERSNTEWWLSRVSGTLDIANDTSNFLSIVTSTGSGLVEKSISTILSGLSSEAQATLKATYNFNDEMFGEAEEQGKKVMLILGSKVTSEVNFVDYANFVMTYYGDDYVYYYKGHPGTPTSLYPEKQEQLDSLGIIDVESSIAAELILFFFPDIYMCGYSSSTYLSVQSDEMACALFNVTKSTAGSSYDYADKLDMFISQASSHGTTYDSILNAEHTNYIIEFNDTTDYDFAVYDATENTITYYKNNNGTFEVVQ